LSDLELENPVTTLLRLIKTRIRVIKDNGAVANILSTVEAYDREVLKQYDGQITLGLESSEDKKISLDGSLRRRSMLFKCNSWTMDRSAPGADAGKVMRDKITAQINAIIRENRKLPFQTVYNFSGLGYPSGDPHKAFAAGAATELAPSSTSWAELTNLEYQKLWSSDDVRHSKSVSVNGQYGLMLFKFKLDPRETCVKKIVLSFEGYGTAPAGNGVTIKLWNHAASAWQQAQTGSGSGDETITITISANWPDFIDSNGYVWLLARTTNPSNGSTPAVLYCDFVQCTIQVYGITYCDIVSYRNIDVTDVKPYLFRTEFILKGWLFETIVLSGL
jgi:hypothetical protein